MCHEGAEYIFAKKWKGTVNNEQRENEWDE